MPSLTDTEVDALVDRVLDDIHYTEIVVTVPYVAGSLDDWFEEFRYDAAHDETPDAFDTGIVERPL